MAISLCGAHKTVAFLRLPLCATVRLLELIEKLMREISLLILLSLILFSGCQEERLTKPGFPFDIIIEDQDGNLVPDATIQGGIDWDAYTVQTDEHGRAILPGSAKYGDAVVFKTNYVPRRIENLSPRTYELKRTSKLLRPLGQVQGKAIIFGDRDLITLTENGSYHVYSYTDQSVSEIVNYELLDSNRYVIRTKLAGDNLWILTQYSGFFVYSLKNPTEPNFLFHLNPQVTLGAFVVRDSLLIVAPPFASGPLRFLRWDATGVYREIFLLQSYFIEEMILYGNYLFLLGGFGALPIVLDISTVNSPVIVYNGLEGGYEHPIMHQRHVILTPRDFRNPYKAFDFTNPRDPLYLGAFSALSRLSGFISDSIAYGSNLIHPPTVTVDSGTYYTHFETIATVSKADYSRISGANGSYFIIDNTLMKLIDR